MLATEANAQNGASMLVMTCGQVPDDISRFERILDMFDGNDTAAVEKARSRWGLYKAQGHELAYQKQTDTGGWERKDQ